MDKQTIENALKAIEEQVTAIRSAMGSEQVEEQGNPMVTPEKPMSGMMSGLQLGK